VTVVAQAAPARGGIPSFVESLLTSELAAEFDMRLLNTTRVVERRAGTFSGRNILSVLVDTLRTYRHGRRCEIVHVQTALMPLLPLLRALCLSVAARLAGAAVVCHVHSGRVNSGQPDAFDPSWLTRLLLRRLAVCDLILTVSHAGTRTLRALVPGVAVETVDNAVRLERFVRADPVHVPARLLYVGTLSRRKGLHDLVNALKIVRERGVEGWTLQVVGGSAEVGEQEAEELRQAVRGAGLADSLVGSLDGAAVRERLASSDVFVLPSHWEGQPIAILEAMAAGLAVVTTTVGANPDVLRDHTDGVLVPPHDPQALADALMSVIADPAMRKRLGASARLRIEAEHSITSLVQRMAPLYRQAYAHRRAAN
jgi:glycosyltransferase involved in cell wall biosynthesis